MVETNPFERIMQASTAFWLSRCLHVAANVGLADVLDDTPKTAEELAKATGVDASALARVLRLLSAHDVFASHDGRWSHTPASRMLRSDNPRSLRAFVQMIGSPICWDGFRELEHSLKTSQPAVEKASPGGLFKYFASHPDEARVFDAAMEGKSHGQVEMILGAYDFSKYKSVVDVGGGRGHLLEALLKKVPTTKAVLFDLPHVISSVSAIASDRLTLQPGDFFKDALPSADAFVLMEVIHDWPDAESNAILTAVRRSVAASSKLLLIENLVPETPGPSWAKALDINMLAMTGGRERTRTEYEKLLAGNGFRIDRVVETPSVAILEASPA